MSEHDSNLPLRLNDALARAYTPAPVPPAIDRAVMEGARAHFAGARRRRVLWLTAGPLAAAAGLALAVFMWPAARGPGAGSGGLAKSALPTDLNRDGVLDMLDALVLARRVESGGGQDVNADGVTDRRDVDALAQRAVRLDGGAS